MSETNGTTDRNLLTPEVMQFVSDTVARSMFGQPFGTSHGELRNYYETLGWPYESTYETRYAYATKDSLGRRLVRNFPRHTWQYPPVIRDTEEQGETTPWMEAWESLVTKHQLWRRFERVDRQACIGNYAILFFGLRGREVPSERVTGRQRSAEDLLYVRPYSQRYVRIENYEGDATSERFGLPSTYRLQRGTRPRTNRDEPIDDVPLVATDIDASRVIHVAEDLIEDDVFGVPKLEGTIPRLIDLMKIAGGSAEIFWRHAGREIAITAQENFDFGEGEKAQFLAQVEEFTHRMRNFLFLHGMEAKTLPPGVESPLEHFQVQASLISADWDIPQRLLFGSERGELASTQDIRGYVATIAGRQQHFAQPVVVEATIARLTQYGILPEPAMPLIYEWPDLFSLGDEELAKIAADWATALQRHSQAEMTAGGAVITREEARATIFAPLGIPAEEPLEPAEEDIGNEDEMEDGGGEDA